MDVDVDADVNVYVDDANADAVTRVDTTSFPGRVAACGVT
jgi:hypothetical protein